MKKSRASFRCLVAGWIGMLLALATFPLPAATRTWDGSSSGLWTTAANWDINTVPVNGDLLIFPPGPARLLTTNGVGGATNFHSLTIGGSNYVLLGAAPLSITNGLTNVVAAANATNTVRAHLVPRASQTWVTSVKSVLVLASNVSFTNLTLTLKNDSLVRVDGAINGGAGSTLNKTNNGTLEINGAASLTHLHAQDGAVQVDGTLTGLLTIGAGATLSGSGTVPAFTNFGTVAPGSSSALGLLTVSGGASVFQPGGSMHVQVQGTVPGTGHDQLRVATPPNLTHAALTVLRDVGSPLALGEKFVIITNTGAGFFTTTFTNRPQGAFITNAIPPTTIFQISYTGGSGNDVELTVVGVLSPPSGVTRTWDGGGTNNAWSNPTNWVGDITPGPGDDLVFPESALRRTNVNDFATGFTINSIRMVDGGYRLTGANALRLLGGISAAPTNLPHRLDMPLLLAQAQTFNQDGIHHLFIDNTIDLGASTLTVSNQGNITMNARLSGAGGVVKMGAGELFLSVSNSFAGPVDVAAGNLRIGNAASLGDLSSGTTVESGGILELFGNLALTEPLSLAGTLQSAGGTNQIQAPLTLTGLDVAAGSFPGAALIFNAPITESVPGAQLRLQGDRVVLNASNSYTRTVVSSSHCVINGSQPGNIVDLSSGTLEGHGVIGTLTPGMGLVAVAPGESPGILTSSNLVWNSFLTYRVELPGLDPGPGHDQLAVHGTVTLGGAKLAVTNVGPASVGTTFTIIDNDGADAVSGAFNGLPEGAFRTNGITQLQISYTGGDGNDVVLTVTGLIPTGVTLVWSGLGTNGLWSNPSNWIGGVVPQPGDTLSFPDTAPLAFATNDLGSGFLVNRLLFSGTSLPGTELFGDRIGLLAGISVNLGDDVELHLPITLLAGQTWDDGRRRIRMHGPLNVGPHELILTGLTGFANDITFNGEISGTGVIRQTGRIATFLNASNSFSGTLFWQDGLLLAAHTNALGGAGSGPTIVGQNTELVLTEGAYHESFIVATGRVHRLAGGTLATVVNAAWTLGGTQVVMEVSSAGPNVNLTLTGPMSGPGGLLKLGPMPLRLTGTNTFTGPTAINEGKLLVNGPNPASPVTILSTTNTALLGGTGIVGHVTALGGTVSPGESAGILTVSNLSLSASSLLAIEINGLTPGSGHDQIMARGSVSLASAGLFVSLGFTQAVGTSVTIIDNDGVDPVAGIFTGLNEGDTFTLGGVTFRISYLGGDGNDVALTRIILPTGLTRVWSGAGANSRWTNDLNWVGNVAPVPGDSLEFPPGAARLNNTNTFPAGTVFNAVRLTGGGYTLEGNLAGLLGGIDHPPGASNNTMRFPITLHGNAGFTNGATNIALNLFGTVNLNGHGLVLDGAGRMEFLGVLSGAGPLTKSGSGLLQLYASNTYSGTTLISGGSVNLLHNQNFGAAGAGTFVADGAFISVGSPTAQLFQEPLTLGGQLSAGFSTRWSGVITLNSTNAAMQVSGSSQLAVDSLQTAPGADLAKLGSGTLILNATNSDTIPIEIFGGTLQVDGSLPNCPVLVPSASALTGTGAIGTVLPLPGQSLAVSPGVGGPGILHMSNLTLNAASSLFMELNGTAPGTGHGQLDARGTVDLGGAALGFSLAFTPSLGAPMIILNNDGVDPIVGTFNGLPEGATITSFPTTLRLSYLGGDGNDVTLTSTLNAPASTIQFSGLNSNGLFTLTGAGFSNAPYVLEATTNLNTPILWQPVLTNLSGGDGLYQFIDPSSTNFPVRFYRVLSP